MPYTMITSTPFGAAAIEYALGGSDNKGHNGNETRNVIITGVNLDCSDPTTVTSQMQPFWDMASWRNRNRIQRITISFSKNELDPDDPNSYVKAAMIAEEYAIRNFPDRQTLICIQNDGVGGCVHAHVFVSNVSMYSHKGFTDEQTKWANVVRTVDAVAEEFIELDQSYDDVFDEYGHRKVVAKDKVNRTVRVKRQQNEAAIANGETENLNYIWTDDLKDRIKLAMSEVEFEEELLTDFEALTVAFAERLTAHGVEITRAGFSKKYNQNYFSYKLLDTSSFDTKDLVDGNGVVKDFVIRSYNLGTDFMPNALIELLKEKQNEAFDELDDATPETSPVKSEEELEEHRRKNRSEIEFATWALNNGYIFEEMDPDSFDYLRIQYRHYLQEKERQAEETAPEVVTEIAPEVTEPVTKIEASPVQASYQLMQQILQKDKKSVGEIDDLGMLKLLQHADEIGEESEDDGDGFDDLE